MSNEINEKIVEVMFSIARAMHSTTALTPQANDLSIQQIHAGIFFSKHPNATMSDVASYFSITLPSATVLVDKLIKQDIVVRKYDKKDRRVIHVHLTKRGKKEVEQLIKQRSLKANKFLSYLSIDEKKDLCKILSSIQKKLETS